MTCVRSFTVTLMPALVLPLGAAAGDPAEPVGPTLPPKVHGPLLQEMNAILGASQDITVASACVVAYPVALLPPGRATACTSNQGSPR